MSQIKSLTDQIVAFRDARDWKQFHNAKDLALSLSLEAAEVLELYQWKTGPAIDAVASAQRQDLSDELADVLYYTLLMAHDAGIDLQSALQDKLRRNAEKYPVDKARGSSKKYTEL
ncbi:MAG: nucleotide pyrophosphohydrolase [Moraxellaceae bacterium]|nr:nucleotide pyrophosphohydrolase [Moraxellaceae bacterium]